MVTTMGNENERPVWFVTGGANWRLRASFWQCEDHDGQHRGTIREMRPGDRIAMKTDRFNDDGSLGIWAIGSIVNVNGAFVYCDDIWQNSHGMSRYENKPRKNCSVETIGKQFSEDMCIWQVHLHDHETTAFVNDVFHLVQGVSETHTRYTSTQKDSLESGIILADGCFLDQPTLEKMLRRLQTKQNIILQGPPGTGKTWLAKRLAYSLIGRKDKNKVRSFQFHPNMSYEDFVRGWRPDGEGGLVLADGPFLKLSEDAREDPDGKYVMVIEEINRGNPASIFGELLTLLEADKRDTDNSLQLAYPRDDDERFHIPPNVYVIGTMNTADRSIAMLDLALRRRFAFFNLEPQLNDAWREWVSHFCDIPEQFLTDIAQRIAALNDQIAAAGNLGQQFRIGHSYVTPAHGTPVDNHTEWFKEIVETDIAPLLNEYWFDNVETANSAKSELLSGL